MRNCAYTGNMYALPFIQTEDYLVSLIKRHTEGSLTSEQLAESLIEYEEACQFIIDENKRMKGSTGDCVFLGVERS